MVLRNLPGSKPGEPVALSSACDLSGLQTNGERSDLFASTAATSLRCPLHRGRSRTWRHLIILHFSTFGVHPVLGRLFGHEVEKPGLAPEAVVSYRFWENYLVTRQSSARRSR